MGELAHLALLGEKKKLTKGKEMEKCMCQISSTRRCALNFTLRSENVIKVGVFLPTKGIALQSNVD